MEKKDKTLAWVGLIIGLIGIFSALFGVVAFNRYVVMLIPLIPRMITVIVSYWIVAAVPILVMIFSKDKVSDLGFTKEKIGFQILIGVLLGIGMSLVLTLVPHLAGFGDYVDPSRASTRASMPSATVSGCPRPWSIKATSPTTMLGCIAAPRASPPWWATALPWATTRTAP